MTFFLLSLQSIVCIACVVAVKKLGIISFRNFDVQDAKAWLPVSILLVNVIYTGSKSLVSIWYAGRPLVIPERTVQSNTSPYQYTRFSRTSPLSLSWVSGLWHVISLIVLAQAYGEIIWFNGRITGLTMIAFLLMVSGAQRGSRRVVDELSPTYGKNRYFLRYLQPGRIRAT